MSGSWFEVDGDRAEALLRDLAAWVDGVLTRYRTARDTLPACWHRHPAAVEALLALRRAWAAAYEDDAAPGTAAAEWHHRHLPGIIDVLRREQLGGCAESSHGPGGEIERYERGHQRPGPEPERAARYARWWADGHGEGDEPDLDEAGARPLPRPYGGGGAWTSRRT
jgi:hypothetical protein